ncbi:MAG: hypothetical protein V3T80_03500 [Kiloniellales bacterium]
MKRCVSLKPLALASAISVMALVSACGGKSANPVNQYQPGDEARSCEGLKTEISSNEAEIARLIPYEDATGKNVALGVAGAFFIVPWFFMDFKEGEATELQALRRRNQWLREVASGKDCSIPASQFVFNERPCAEASNPDRPWIGEWAAKNETDLLALSITQYQVNGQLKSQGGTFQVSGRVNDQGIIQASITADWDKAELSGQFPDLSARTEGGSRIGSITSTSDTPFRMCK